MHRIKHKLLPTLALVILVVTAVTCIKVGEYVMAVAFAVILQVISVVWRILEEE
ncbi:hypothetical protein ACYSNW_04595 [Enterococcus sp. LJL99]